jgi:hypothetical protein
MDALGLPWDPCMNASGLLCPVLHPSMDASGLPWSPCRDSPAVYA